MIRSAAIAAAAPVLARYPVSEMLWQGKPGIASMPDKRFGDGRDWFYEKRFGMFIHWGIYSIPAWHEQHQWRARVPREKYAALASEWNPVSFNPDKWIDLMQEAGMKYITFTTKHHDGFCMWDTALTRFNTMNTPCHRDILRQLSDACHRRKVPLCLYYSVVDWNHPNYPNMGRTHELPGPEPGDNPDWNKYIEFLKGQVKELCTNYGEISGFWWDMNVPKYKDTSINDMIRKLQPNAVINNRGFDDGDFGTPERDFDAAATEARRIDKPIEACQSVGAESWGYKSDEDYYSDFHLKGSIDRYLARGANYLLNVGPDAKGLIPDESAAILKRIGKWYHSVSESFDAEPAQEVIAGKDVLLTRKKNILYIHFHKGSLSTGYKLKPLASLPEKITLLNDGSHLQYALNLLPSDYLEEKPYLRIRNLPVNAMAGDIMVVKLEFSDEIN